MMGGSTGKSRDRHVADLIEAAFLEITGAPASDDDLRVRIAFGDRGNTSADDLAMAQLRLLQDPDAALVTAKDPDLVAGLDDSTGTFDDFGSTDEDDAAFGGVSQGDSEASLDPIGDLIGETPDALEPVSAEPAPAISASVGIVITSEVPAGVLPSATAMDQLALPVAQP